MRWGLALGAAATLGAAAVIGTQWKGNPVVTPEAPAQAAPAPSREALARAAAEARGAEGQATVSSLASMDLCGRDGPHEPGSCRRERHRQHAGNTGRRARARPASAGSV